MIRISMPDDICHKKLSQDFADKDRHFPVLFCLFTGKAGRREVKGTIIAFRLFGNLYFVRIKKRNPCKCRGSAFRDPAGTRTQGPNIKSVMLYQLSYEIYLFSRFGSAKIALTIMSTKIFCCKFF